MANYNSIEELFDAGISNMEVLVNNVAHDDDVITTTGVPWVLFKGVAANNIYVGGNTFFGIGANAEHLQVNRRDTKLWYLYREEGTLYNFYRFLKYRWRGYSQYNTTAEANLMEYDVVFWELGHISLHMTVVPTAAYNGTFNLAAASAVAYRAPTAQSPDVTFYAQDEAHGVYTAVSERIDLLPPFDRKYLIKNTLEDGTIQLITISEDGELEVLPEDTELVSDTFREYGVDEVPDANLLIGMTDPQVYFWQDSTEYDLPQMEAYMRAWQAPQVLYSPDYDMTHSTIKGIETIRADCSEDVLFAISFDEGATWKAHNGTSWGTVTEAASGMTAAAMAAISVDDWALVAITGKYRVRCVLLNEESFLREFIVDYLN